MNTTIRIMTELRHFSKKPSSAIFSLCCWKQMYIYERLATVNTAPLYIFMLLFSIAQAKENVSVYFSLQENRAIQGVPFISSFYTEDVMLCACSCAEEFDCNTANYRAAENKCDISRERMDDVSNEVAMVFLRGCYLIKKVKTDPQDTKDPTPSVTWFDFTPQWCTLAGRASIGNNRFTAKECKEKCTDGCLGVEWWENLNGNCFECTDPSKKTSYTDTNDLAYPPHVFLKNNN